MSDKNKSLNDIAAKYGYSLVDSNHDDPKVIIIGSTHASGPFDDAENIAEIILSTAKSGDFLMTEGGRGEYLKEKAIDGVSNIVKDTELGEFITAFFNDVDVMVFWEYFGLMVNLSVASEPRKTTLKKEIYALFKSRDSLMCFDDQYGLVPNLKKRPENKAYQIVGFKHVTAGNLIKNLKKKNIPFSAYVKFNEGMRYFPGDKCDFSYGIEKNWIKIAHELGYIGTKKDVIEKIDNKFSKIGWRRAHIFGNILLTRDEVIKHYEDSYFFFMRDNPSITDWLINTASDVYDTSPSNINSGTDYNIQEDKATHLQDIAIRNVLIRLGKEFKGNRLVQIRGHTSEGYVLNPGQVPFHSPEMIIDSGKENWWKKGSTEHFYQDNKILLVNPEAFKLKLEYKTNDAKIYKYDANDYYIKKKNDSILYRVDGRSVRRAFNDDRNSFRKMQNTNFYYASKLF